VRRVDLTLDEAYERMHRTGPEFDGWLSNHGPMAADAILRMGHGPELDRWLQDYAGRLDAAPARRWGIASSDWLEYLGDPSRLGDWTDFFSLRLREEPWREVLTTWWPRLLPGSIAASTHGLIRTGHAVRALLEQETEPRVDELGNALGYWAARWQPLPRAIGSAEAGRGRRAGRSRGRTFSGCGRRSSPCLEGPRFAGCSRRTRRRGGTRRASWRPRGRTS